MEKKISTINIPSEIKTLDMLSPEEFNELLDQSIQEAENGELIPLEEALRSIMEDLK